MPENNGAGCRINATFKIARVPGNFHISTHSSPQQPPNGDMKHVIHELTFGDSIKVRWVGMEKEYLIICFSFLTKKRVFDKFQIDAHSVHWDVSTIPIVLIMFHMIIYSKSCPQYTKIFVPIDAIHINSHSSTELVKLFSFSSVRIQRKQIAKSVPRRENIPKVLLFSFLRALVKVNATEKVSLEKKLIDNFLSAEISSAHFHYRFIVCRKTRDVSE